MLVVALGRRLADQMQDNLLDVAGPGDYRAPFVEMLNERLDDYAGSSSTQTSRASRRCATSATG